MNRIRKSQSVFVVLLLAGGFSLAASAYLDAPSSPSASLLQSGPARPSAIKELGTPAINPGQTREVVEITPRATNVGVFTVPGGQVFILTDLVVFPERPGSGTISLNLIQDGRFREFYRVPNDRPFSLHLNTGLVFDSGFSFSIRNDSSSAGPFRVEMTGFLNTDL